MKAIVAYVPAIHQGYFHFFAQHAPDARELYVLASGILGEIDHLRKDLRALDPYLAVASVRAWHFFDNVCLLDPLDIVRLDCKKAALIMPDEEISRHVGGKYFPNCAITYDNVFLRRDKQRALAQEPVNPDHIISCRQFDQEMMAAAIIEGERSSDWWRRVGGILVRDGEVILVAHNRHLPNENSPGLLGDYRSNFSKGVAFELTSAEHAESVMLGTAARRGITTDGASLYLNDFPCPPCAKYIARAGIRKLYYATGSYSMVETEENLRTAGVEIVLVQMESPSLP